MYFHTHLCTHTYIYIKQNKEPPESELRDILFFQGSQQMFNIQCLPKKKQCSGSLLPS